MRVANVSLSNVAHSIDGLAGILVSKTNRIHSLEARMSALEQSDEENTRRISALTVRVEGLAVAVQRMLISQVAAGRPSG